MKKKNLAIVLSVSLLLSSISLLSFAATVNLGTDDDPNYIDTGTNTETDGLSLSKSVTQEADDNDEYTITLETYVTGDVVTSNVSIPNDIIIIMDMSGSMDEDMDGDSTNIDSETREYALKQAVYNFIDTVADDATENNVDHTIALVEFATTTSSSGGGGGTTYTPSATSTNHYYDVSDPNNVATLDDWVEDLEADGGTGTQEGMEEALSLLENNITDEERNQVVILFTDGQPGLYDFDIDYADAAMDSAYTMKNTYDATIYSVGIFTGADATYTSGSSATATSNGNTGVGSRWTYTMDGNYKADDTYINNRFLNFISSNSSNATSLGITTTSVSSSSGNTGPGGGGGTTTTYYYEITDEYDWSNQGYYLTATTADELDNIFQSIASTTVASSMSLGTETRVEDYVSEYFQMPDDFSVDDVTIEIVPCTGTDDDGEYTWDDSIDEYGVGDTYYYYDYTNNESKTATFAIEYDEENKGVLVTGFDYGANFVTDTDKNSANVNGSDADYGYKLVVSFNIKRLDGFIGGNDVTTNTAYSGIYTPLTDSDGTFVTNDDGSYVYNSLSVEEYIVPDTQVELVYELTTQDQTIYLGNRISLYKILQINGHDVLGVSNEFVDIVFYIYDTGYLDSLEDDKEPDPAEAIAEFTIPAGYSAEDAALLVVNQPLDQVLPPETTTYDVYVLVSSHDAEEAEILDVGDLGKYDLATNVYVLQPSVEGTDIWVDFGAQTNLREDSTTPITWLCLENSTIGQGNLYDANADYAPTVYYIYHNTVTNEYFKTQYQVDWNNDGDYDDFVYDTEGKEVYETGSNVGETVTVTTWDGFEITYTVVDSLDINIESEKQYDIVAIQTLSSDGYYNIEYWSAESDVYNTLVDSEGITENNVMNIYINKYNVDITKTVTTTEEEWATYPQSFIFEVSQTAYDYNEDLGVEDSTGDYTTDNEGTEYGITYRDPDIVEIVMQPSDFELTSINEDGTVNYTATVTVTGLRAGLDAVITEDEDWSWRYDLTETSVDTTITAGTVIDTDIILTEPITLNEDTTLSATSTLATGSVLATGTDLSANTTLPAGSQIATDVILSAETTGHVFYLPVILSADTVITGGNYEAQEDATLTTGTTFAGEVVINDKTYNSGDVLTEDITLTSAVTLVEGTILGAGSKILQANQLPDGTKIPAGTELAYDVEISQTTTLDVGVIISAATTFSSGTVLAKGTILTEGTTLPGDIDITAYGTIDAIISTDNVITVNYSHDLYTTGYENDEMGLDTNKNGFNDTIVDITGDGIPDTQAFVYRDRNNDTYTDIDVLAPYVSEAEVEDGDYTNFDISFDLDNDSFIDLIVSADDAEDDGRRLITASMTAYTTDYFVGFYINEDGNIEAEDGTLIYNRASKYFNGYFVYYSQDESDESYGSIVGGNGGIYLTDPSDPDNPVNYSGSATDLYIVSADDVGVDGDGDNNIDHAGATNIVIEDSAENEYYGTGYVIIADPVNLDLFNRDGDSSTALEPLPLLIRDTYRYINSNEYIVFTGEYDRDDDGSGDPPADGQIDTYFTNVLTNESWLSYDTIAENVFSGIDAIVDAMAGGAYND